MKSYAATKAKADAAGLAVRELTPGQQAFVTFPGKVTVEIQEANPNDARSAEMAEPLPFPFNQRTYCNYEPIEKSIDQARVLIVDNLLRDEGDLSQVAREEWGKEALNHLKRERQKTAVRIRTAAALSTTSACGETAAGSAACATCRISCRSGS